MSVSVLRSGDRAAAVAFGRRLGEDEARRRKEIGKERDRRVANAVRYAEWEFDTRALRRRKPVISEGAVT